jgi:S-adenosyl methyltransferase
MGEAVRLWNEQGSAPMTLRTREGLLRFFERVDLLEPGVVSCSRWRPEDMDIDEAADVPQFCGVGRTPSPS